MKVISNVTNLNNGLKFLESFNSKMWLDFLAYPSDDKEMTILASDDFCYYHELEIITKKVTDFYIKSSWESNPSKMSILELTKSINNNNKIVITFHSEDKEIFFIECLEIEFIIDIVRTTRIS